MRACAPPPPAPVRASGWHGSAAMCRRSSLANTLCVCMLLSVVAVHGGGPRSTNCAFPGAPNGAPCGPGHEQCCHGAPNSTCPMRTYTKPSAVFHLGNTQGCGENDPNGPFYDPMHGMYHQFFQDHLALKGGGISWGHWASRDFVKWTSLPVAIWADQWYDGHAIFTGSATLDEHDNPVITYPGMCGCPPSKKNQPKPPCDPRAQHACRSGAAYSQAVPSNRSDPLLKNWSKPEYNPIVNSTGDDPSTAWKTPYGEWRFIGNGGRTMPLFVAKELGGPWSIVGNVANLTAGECPSLFPLPPLTPGTSAKPGQKLPTHVYKRGRIGGPTKLQDHFQIGDWVEGKPGEVAVWTPTPNIPWQARGGGVLVDEGLYYASKDFWDPVKKRRILWGWSTGGPPKALPRELTYHPTLQSIVQHPVAELDELHEELVVDATASMLAIGEEKRVGTANATDAVITFTLPRLSAGESCAFGFATQGVVSSDGSNHSVLEDGFIVTLNYTLPNATERASGINYVDTSVAITAQPAPPPHFQSSVDFAATAVDYDDDAASSYRSHGGPHPPPPPPAPIPQLGLLTNETEVKLRVFTDGPGKSVEIYWMGGRKAITRMWNSHNGAPLETPTGDWRGGMSVFNHPNSTTTVEAKSVKVWTMGSVWATEEEVLATPRRDGMGHQA